MLPIHCHRCGGFIDNPAGISYREPNAATPPVVPHSALCSCEHAVLYGAAPGPAVAPHGAHNIRSASRN
jgi:hypothetical protein